MKSPLHMAYYLSVSCMNRPIPAPHSLSCKAADLTGVPTAEMTSTCRLSQRSPPSLSCMLSLRTETYPPVNPWLTELPHEAVPSTSVFTFPLQDPISKRSIILSSTPSFPKAPPKTFLSCTLRTKVSTHCE